MCPRRDGLGVPLIAFAPFFAFVLAGGARAARSWSWDSQVPGIGRVSGPGEITASPCPDRLRPGARTASFVPSATRLWLRAWRSTPLVFRRKRTIGRLTWYSVASGSVPSRASRSSSGRGCMPSTLAP